jgi:methoxymalonate biosynthesis acyl carrier protein
MMDERETIRAFVSRFFRGHALRDDEDMFSTGYVNSMFAMQLVAFIEQAFGFQVEGEDLDLDNFRSVDALVGFVARKQGAAA